MFLIQSGFAANRLCDKLRFNQPFLNVCTPRLFGRTMTSRHSTHLGQIRNVTRRSEGCEQCLALGDTWVHLRMCMVCGQLACCDSSKNKHAHAHARQSDHQIAR
jgi:Zn-finger in ubiquitin-hydrolases and other protein